MYVGIRVCQEHNNGPTCLVVSRVPWPSGLEHPEGTPKGYIRSLVGHLRSDISCSLGCQSLRCFVGVFSRC